jgi:hypothetical protein
LMAGMAAVLIKSRLIMTTRVFAMGCFNIPDFLPSG